MVAMAIACRMTIWRMHRHRLGQSERACPHHVHVRADGNRSWSAFLKRMSGAAQNLGGKLESQTEHSL